MLDYLLGIDLLLLTVAQAILVWHCHDWRRERVGFTESISARADRLTDDIGAVGAILEDIADLLDGQPASGPAPGGSAPPLNLPELLLTGLMSRMSMPPTDGTPDEIRPILKTEDTPPNEVGSQPPESG